MAIASASRRISDCKGEKEGLHQSVGEKGRPTSVGGTRDGFQVSLVQSHIIIMQ